MNDDERTTALGFYHFAHSYAASARSLSQLVIHATHSDAPVRFLFRHAVELYLKAYLRHQGVTVVELAKRSLGHSTVLLLARASELGLQLQPGDQTLIHALDDAISDRYLRTGARRILSAEQAHELCSRLNMEIGFAIYSANDIRRSLPKL